MTIDLEKIAGDLGKPRQNADGSFNCCCPAHDDNNPSLSITDKDGKLLVYCHAGCSQSNVIERLIERDLWPNTSRHPVFPQQKGQQLSPVPEGIEERPRIHPHLGEPTHVYTYLNLNGQAMGYIYRFDRPDGSKEFRPLVFTADGWKWQGFDKPRPLYGLEQVKNALRFDFLNGAPTNILVVEGEKAADAARKMLPGKPVLTWSGGSKAVSATDWSPLHGYSVTIWPDNDDAGKMAALDVADLLSPYCQVGIVDPPASLPKGWDLADAVALC